MISQLTKAGWAHNDIKAENYVIDSKTGEVVVIDLGGAAGQGAMPGAGTDEYAAPEMLTGGKVDFSVALGTTRTDVFSLGATLAHATEAPDARHEIARPNQGVKVKPQAFTDYQSLGRVKNPFEHGAKTHFTLQLERMMNTNPLERGKVYDEQDWNNRFLYDSILSDHETREVLKGVVSGSLKTAWEQKWLQARPEHRKLKPKPGRTRMAVEDEWKFALSRHVGKDGKSYGADLGISSNADKANALLIGRQQELDKLTELIQEANAFGIDTRQAHPIVKRLGTALELARQEFAKKQGKQAQG